MHLVLIAAVAAALLYLSHEPDVWESLEADKRSIDGMNFSQLVAYGSTHKYQDDPMTQRRFSQIKWRVQNDLAAHMAKNPNIPESQAIDDLLYDHWCKAIFPYLESLMPKLTAEDLATSPTALKCFS